MIPINWYNSNPQYLASAQLVNTREILARLQKLDQTIWASKVAELRRTERALENQCACLDAMCGGNI
jgi:hypothetical protein